MKLNGKHKSEISPDMRRRTTISYNYNIQMSSLSVLVISDCIDTCMSLYERNNYGHSKAITIPWRL